MEKTGVIIDGALPRTPRERCQALFDYLGVVGETGAPPDFDPAIQTGVLDQADEFWHEFEDELVVEIEKEVAPWYVVTRGEHTPGDVVVVPWGDGEEQG